MILDREIRNQLGDYLKLMEEDIRILVSVEEDSASKDIMNLVEEIASMSPKIKVEKGKLPRTPSFRITRINEDLGVTFAGVPLGHEFTSLVLALLQVSGRPPKVDAKIAKQIKNLKGDYNFETYISLSCHNCPEVVQALNIMSILNPRITHTMVDGALFQEEVESKDIMAVPTTYLNGDFFSSGRVTLEEILSKLDVDQDQSEFDNKDPFDVLVVGGGPAGASAAIYAARKGIRTGIVAERFGGQVRDTKGIENFISVKYIEGSTLASSLEEHVGEYDIDVILPQKVKSMKKEDYIHIELEKGGTLKSKTVIISTGARWRNVNVPGEAKYKNKGIAYCPHCDGPLFAGKEVAVIGGGNSGIEAAIDLAGVVKHVTVLEFLPELKADLVLQERLYSLANVTVLKNVETKEITGDRKVNGITYMDRDTQVEKHIELQGVFVQIGLMPNTEWVGDFLEQNQYGEIIIDKFNATNIPGVFAAGDCTDVPNKQIIISMGSGANAALGAFDYLIRN